MPVGKAQAGAMKPINVAVILRGSDMRERRLLKTGWWTYEVPEFTWTLYPAKDIDVFYRDQLAQRGHQAIIYEDWQWSGVIGPPVIPLVYVIVDSNTSEKRLIWYRKNAAGQGSDLILLDQDNPKRFRDIAPARRWAYGVNEQVWYPPETKSIDVGYFCVTTPERAALARWLDGFAKEHPEYVMRRSSQLDMPQYIEVVRQSKLVIHLPTEPQCRTHRVFDVLASGGCLLTAPWATISGDDFEPGTHYVEWRDYDELGAQIVHLLETGEWQQIARQGREHVLSHHTWAHRARELRTILGEVFSWLN